MQDFTEMIQKVRYLHKENLSIIADPKHNNFLGRLISFFGLQGAPKFLEVSGSMYYY